MTILRAWLLGMVAMASCWPVACANGGPGNADAVLAAGAGGNGGVQAGDGVAGGGGTLEPVGEAGPAGTTGAEAGGFAVEAAASGEDPSVTDAGGGEGGSPGASDAADGGSPGKGGAGGGGSSQGGEAGAADATGAGGGQGGGGGGQGGTVASWWPAAYDAKESPSPSDGHHRDGESCLSCHTEAGEAPAWLFGATVYNASGTSGLAHVQVGIRDGVQFYSAYSGENGNVWIPQGSSTINWDNAEIRVRNGFEEMLMSSRGDNGDCNHCHDSKFRIVVP
jgi:hypothetical protein